MRELLKTGFVLDGAMGTQLIERGLTQGQSSALWSVDRPDDILAVHRAYADAGAQAITANTFSANRFMLAAYSMEGRLAEINRAAVDLARRTGLPVLGDIGPSGEFLEPMGDLEPEDLLAAVQEQATALADAGVDGFLVETYSDPGEMFLTLEALKEFGLPIIATFTYERHSWFATMMGTSPAKAVAACAEADAVGANCGSSLSLEDYLVLADELLAATDKPILLQPNAGTPKETGAGVSYDVTPEAFAEFGVLARAKGVGILGGCCGTSPAHIAALSAGLASQRP
ncbi:MAG TPA: homocysteine S-methyltransferase family protein [Fimbriimonas sp.]